MKKYQNKYRIPSARLQSWDYGNNGAYFITICTANRDHFFGDIVDTAESDESIMQLNALGKIAKKYWMKIPDHFPFVKLGNFVVMPNHTHGILIIDKNIDTADSDGDLPDSATDPVETPKLGASTHNDHGKSPADNDKKPTVGGKNEKWKPQTIGVIINQYKRIVTINTRKINAHFGWQSRFYDHIIRDDGSFQRIQKYIADNPKKWGKDKFNG